MRNNTKTKRRMEVATSINIRALN